ncbi:DUF3293 domain-containing protein [Cupriavidus basilensis]|uniref:DUF3293 domain-containing protein n=1 Tax=Cupriavidus basilensis TaxID=68895 RepID=A0ABT6AJE3_9BURK|nr:DUF3293 domain-containing protein [Cupriavidus basilensis]MDF3832712.1 DUF3293 domain-containing protein [Cupriavidus basilensis]
MFSASVIGPEIVQAYLETHYHVHGDAPVTLKVGEPNALLAALHADAGVQCSAFITAWNPFSQPAGEDASVNARRQQALARELAQAGLRFIEGIGQHPSNQWPGEASFLVLGLTLDAAKALGTRHEQNAIIWSGADAVPQLILLR